jgi:hypothetical protein
MTTPAPSPGDLRARLLGRAMTDELFRQQLLADPKAAIREALGITLPDSLEVQVMEETASRLCLVLPARPRAAGALSEEQLSAVAGGIDTVPLPDRPNPELTPVYGFDRLTRFRAR